MGFSSGGNSFGESIMKKLFDLISAIISVLFSSGYLKSLAAILIFSSFCLAQQRNTVFLILAQNLTTTGNVTYLVNNNIGQNFHTFVIYAPQSSSCTSGILATYYQNTTAQIEASYDGVNYNQIPQTRISYSYDSTNLTSAKYYRAAGAYPYIRIRLLAMVSTCSSNIGYTGLLQANPLTDANSPLTITNVGGISTTCEAFLPASPAGYNVNAISVFGGATNPSATGFISIYTSNLCSSGNLSGFLVGQTIAPDNTGAVLFKIPPNTTTYVEASSGGTGIASMVWYSLIY